MSRPAQLVFDLTPDPAHGREDFLVAACNRDAVAWLDLWPAWPAPALVVHGPAGSGKTHLAALFRQRSGGRAIGTGDLEATPPEALLAGVATVILDDLEPVLAAGLAEPLLHLINVAVEQRRHLLLTAEAAPVRLAIALADLRSRLLAAPAVGIGPPDDATLRAVLVKLFADRQISVDAGLPDYLLVRIERSFAAVRTVVDRLDRASLSARRPVNAALARTVLPLAPAPPDRPPDQPGEP